MNNSAHFISTISSERILDNEIMVSFDVESLFTNVPIEAAVDAALQKLENDPIKLCQLTSISFNVFALFSLIPT